MSTSCNGTPLVTFRSHQDLHYEVPEQYFQICETYVDGAGLRLTGTRVAPIGDTLQQQLLALHATHSGDSPEALRQMLRVSRTELDQASCPQLQTSADKLAKVKIHVPSRWKEAIHPVVRHVVVKTGMGNIDAELFDERDPLVKWAAETFEALSRCTNPTEAEAPR